MLRELVANTPIDTGRARASWSVPFSKGRAIVRNSVDYIGDLNEGSSKQAPAHFIESVAMRYGRPNGVIVNRRD